MQNIKTPLTLSELTNSISSAEIYFNKKKKNASRNLRYKKAQHWSEEEKRKIEAQNRRPFSMSLITHKINMILATQRANRTVFKCLPRSEDAGELKAAIVNRILNDKARITDLNYLESEIFDAGLSLYFGVVEVYLDEKLGCSEVKLRKIDSRNFLWDNNARDYSLADALFVTKIQHLYRYQIEMTYGADCFHSSMNKEPIQANSTSSGYSQNNDYEILPLYVHYQKALRAVYYLVSEQNETIDSSNNNCPSVLKFSDKKSAEAKLQEFYNIAADNQNCCNYQLIEKREEAIDKYVFTQGKILSYEKTLLEKFPFAVYRSFHNEEDFWTLTDILLDAQIFLDRVFMQIDYGFGRDVKNVFQANINVLADNETPESAKYKAETTGGIIWTRTNDEAFKPLRFTGVNPQYFQIAQVMQQFLEDMSGGRSFQGLGDYNGESGKAITAKQHQGMLAAGLFLDNLERWKKDLGEKLIEWIIKFENSEFSFSANLEMFSELLLNELSDNKLISTVDSAEGEVVVKVNHQTLDLLNRHEGEIEISVIGASVNPEEKNERFRQLNSLNQLYPGSVPLETILETINIDDSIKHIILQNYNKSKAANG